MKKVHLLSLACLPFISLAEVTEYKGKVTDLLMGKSEIIKVGINNNEEDPIECSPLDAEQPWLLSFERGHSYSDHWFETLNLVRRTQETIRIGYMPSDDSECAIEYIALLKGDGTAEDDVPISDSLERTGQYGNIAQIYTNGLTESNYHASDYYGGDEPSAAFDGHLFDKQIVEGEGSLISRGIWLVSKKSENNENGYWLQVQFEQPVTISGFRVMLNAKSAELGRGPRQVTVLTSADGTDFVEQGQYSLSKSVDQRANLPAKIEASIFRLRIESNYGDSFIEVDELEVYSN